LQDESDDEQLFGKHVALPGSERSIPPLAQEIGPVDPEEKIDVTIIVRPRSSGRAVPEEKLRRSPPGKRRYLTREEYASSRGADSADLEKVSKFVKQYDLAIVEVNQARRTILVSGSARMLSKAFNATLKRYRIADGTTFKGRSGAVHVPSSLLPIIQAVLGLDDRPQARAHFRTFRFARAPTISYDPPQLAKLYDFPQVANGQGQCIGIIELGGGFSKDDLSIYFTNLKLNVPELTTVSVDGAVNSPTGDPNGPDGEVMLDIEVTGAIAQSAKIVVYFAPNTDRGFIDAVSTAVHDTKNSPSVISISWGGPENSWTSQAMQALDQNFQAATLLGVTVCVASGDGGSSDGETDGLAHVDFPASSPHILACGGTRLVSSMGQVKSEVAWNDEAEGGGATGGGVSDVFPLPDWQGSANVPLSANPGRHKGRGVPDVSGDADPETGYVVQVDGTSAVIGGTSAVAPLWAALIALINQALDAKLGFVNSVLYEKVEAEASSALRDIENGGNGAYSAGPGWDPCTGLGSPDGTKLLDALRAL